MDRSTDSTLKLWDRDSTSCKRTFTGHQNEKNFVGLSINGDWISCGSEVNTLYTYHKSSSIPVTKYKFPSQSPPSLVKRTFYENFDSIQAKLTCLSIG